MARNIGRPEIAIGVIDGPVDTTHPDLVHQTIRVLATTNYVGCVDASSAACRHGTFVTGMLAARRSSESIPGFVADSALYRSGRFCRAAVAHPAASN
jgi:hypothetical protein